MENDKTKKPTDLAKSLEEVTEPTEQPVKTEAPQQVSPEFMTMMTQMNQQIIDLQKQLNIKNGSGDSESIKELLRNLPNANSSGLKFRLPTDEDVMDEQVSYYVRGVGFCFTSYDMDGVKKIAPYKPIRFDYMASDRRQRGDSIEETVHIAQFTTKLKSEADYIERSPYFLSVIFRNDPNTLFTLAGNSFAARFTTITSEVAKMQAATVTDQCKLEKIYSAKYAITELRQLLAAHLTQKQMAKELEVARNRVQEVQNTLET